MSAAAAEPAALQAALERAAAALAAGDGPAADDATAQAVRCCAALDAAGIRLSPEALAAVRELHAHGLAQALAAREHLAAELERAGRSRRAASAYGAR